MAASIPGELYTALSNKETPGSPLISSPLTETLELASSAASMEAASTMNRINFASAAPLRRRTPPWTWNPLKSKPYALKGTTFLTITHCSTKPNFLSEKDPSLHSPLSPPSSCRGLVFDLGSDGSWDSAEIGNPVVKRFLSDDEERWYMWYYGRSNADNENPNSDSIGLVVSSNGIHWERSSAPVMKCGTDWWVFDTLSIRPCEVVVMSSSKVRASSSVYWLYYTGCSHEKVNLESKDQLFMSLPGLAMSQDGKNWARIEGDHHSGALIDVGSDNEWDNLFIAGAKVVFHGNGDLRMYYHSFDAATGEFCIGIARSRDGIKWVKLGKVLGGRRGYFDECGVVNPHVVKNGSFGYLMVYEGVGNDGKRRIGVAVSSDGLKEWRRLKEEPILVPSEDCDSWDCVGVESPYLVQLDGDEDEWRLYYRGVGTGGRSGIGMAVSEGTDVTKFRRWSGFHI